MPCVNNLLVKTHMIFFPSWQIKELRLSMEWCLNGERESLGTAPTTAADDAYASKSWSGQRTGFNAHRFQLNRIWRGSREIDRSVNQ